MESHEVMKEVLKKTSAKQIAADLAQGGGKHEAGLALHQFGEGAFRALADVAAQEFGFVDHRPLTPAGGGNGTGAGRKSEDFWRSPGRV